MKKITIITMIYKSQTYLDFIVDQIKRFGLTENVDGCEIDYLVIANDATTPVLDKLRQDGIKHIIYNDPKPDDYYLNRVYRAWNFGGFNADGDIILFVNSDMAFSHGWIKNLYKWLDKGVIPCSFLVESGKMPSMQPALSTNRFGQSAKDFKENEFLEFAAMASVSNKDKGFLRGLYMPSMFYKKEFVESGGFPEGNLTKDGFGAYPSPTIMSGDAYFFYKNPVMSTRQHITVADSIVFHVQEGEMDE